MTTYLTKKVEDKVYHFRVTPTENGLEIIEGQFYKCISKLFQGAGISIDNVTESDKLKINNEAQKLINDKLNEGFIITDFVESKENTYDVYDKAKYHYGGNFPEELEDFQGFVHTGMFVCWLIDNDLLDEDFFDDCIEDIKRVKNRELTGAQFYEIWMDGVFSIEEVSEIGNRFALHYFDFDTGMYINDYEKTLAKQLPTIFHVQDSWENYEKIRKVIDNRFAEWNNIKTETKPWWKIW
ncbi:hypothetical protein ABDK00_006280 [Niabella insulamsoli]|uniref:DUF7832 domain-containing protein n=1 Tax=Niabella insulamsoli TaxID=3144874 RepID=UPI0031FD4641